MEIFLFYLLFATATAFTSVYELLLPVLKMHESADGPVENKYLIIVTYFIVSLIIAPLVFLSCIIPSMGIVFRDALYGGLFPKE